jgi:competence protein ComEC
LKGYLYSSANALLIYDCQSQRRNPFCCFIIPFLLGIGLGINYLGGVDIKIASICFIALSILFITLNLNYSRFKLYKYQWLGGLLLYPLLFLAGLITVIKYNELNNDNHFSKTKAQYLVVKINNEPNLKNGLLRFTADVEQSVNQNKRKNVSGTLLIAIKDSAAKKLYYGDELLIPAKFNPVDSPFNPAEFNYKRYLANQNIYYESFLFTKKYLLLNSNAGNPVIACSLRLRQHFVEKFKQNMQDTDAIAVASTLILGYKADLSNEVLQAYSKTGTIHVLSVSGAHVAIVYILLTFVLGFLERYQYGNLLKAVIIIAFIWYYSLLTGFSPAVCRAAVMISMIIIGKSYIRYINTLNILAISAFGLLLYDPLFILDVGFELSYLAVCGLIIFQPIVYKWFTFKNKWGDKLWALCSVSIAAQVITFPLSAFYFHQFPVYFLLSNLFIIIPVEIIMYSGILFLLLPQIPVVSKGIAYVLENAILLMNKVLAFIEHSPYASVSKIWLNVPEYLLLYIIIISLFCFMFDRKVWLLKLSMACILLVCTSFSYKEINLNNTNSIAFMNLRKFPGIIFKKGNDAIVLTDVKPGDKTYQYSVQPYLDSCGIKNIHICGLSQNVFTPWFSKQNNLVQFLDKRTYIVNGQLKDVRLTEKLKTDFIYATGNPHIVLTAISNNFTYNTLVADGSNSNNSIARLSKQAKELHTDYKILKRNKSLIIYSN